MAHPFGMMFLQGSQSPEGPSLPDGSRKRGRDHTEFEGCLVYPAVRVPRTLRPVEGRSDRNGTEPYLLRGGARRTGFPDPGPLHPGPDPFGLRSPVFRVPGSV